MTYLDIPDFTCELRDGKVRFQMGNLSTNWMAEDDSFIKRIDESELNKAFLKQHILKEIEIKNTLDEGMAFLKVNKYAKAILKFDEVLFYDSSCCEALLNKSYALFGQKHFVKALRYYRKTINIDDNFKDDDYYKLLLKESNDEISNFPKIKLNIYVGDEYFAKNEFEKAIESYNRAIINPSKFKESIINKLLNKKGNALLKLNKYDEALDCFKQSNNDYAYFGQGYCEFKLALEINDNFKSILKIDKRCMLKQVLILNDSNYFTESLLICDYLLDNHFNVDEFYLKLLNAKKFALKNLDKDLTEINNIFEKIM